MANITGMTYADGTTFIIELEQLRDYINTQLVTDVNNVLSNLYAEYQAGIGNAEQTITDAKTGWDEQYAAFVANFTNELKVLNEAAVGGMVDAGTVRTKLDAIITAAIDALRAEVLAGYAKLGTDGRVTRAQAPAGGVYAWTPATAYTAGERVLSPAGDVVTAYETHTSGAQYNPGNWYADHGYLFANFTYNSPEGEKLNLYYSADGKATAGRGPNPVYSVADGVRDPSVVKIGGTWYMAHGYADPSRKKFAIVSSTDLLTWSRVTEIDVSAATNITRAWAPELVVDGADVYVFFTNVVNEGTGLEAWYIKATNPGLYTWSAPVKLAWTLDPGKVMDPVFTRKGDVWYMFFGDNTYINRATAPSLLGPWTRDKAGDWAGWGANKEAPQIVRVSENLWRLYIDRYEGTAPNWTYPGYAYAESTDLTAWTGLTPVRMGVEAQGIVLRHGSFIKLTDTNSSNQVQGVVSAGQAQRYVEGTTGKFIPGTGTETNIGPITIDTDRSLVTSDFTFPSDGQIKVGATGVYAFNLQAGDDPQNNFGDGAYRVWASIYCVTRGKNIATSRDGAANYEISTGITNFRCNAGEIIEFRVAQFSGAPLAVDCTITATRIS